MNTHEQFRDLLKRYRQGRCTPEEQRLVEEWYARISSEMPPLSSADENLLKQRSWSAVERHIDFAKGRDRSRKLRHWQLIGVAATALIFIVAGIYWRYAPEPAPESIKSPTYQETESAVLLSEGTRPSQYVLPDGSKVRLLPGSRLTLHASFGERKREVFLDGEAFFDIARDEERPFLVYTNGLTAEVLGTSFLISAYSEQKEIIVAVKTGKVSVYTNPNDSDPTAGPKHRVILSPNQKVTYNPTEHIALKQFVDEPEVILPEPTLKDSYTNAPVIEILESLRENYGIDIRYDPETLSNCTLTSDMSEEGFYEQIKIICNALGARYEITEDAVIIEASACSPR